MLRELEGGPFEIRLRMEGNEQKAGYAWYEAGSGSETSYFVLKEGISFPLEYGPDVIFKPHEMSGVEGAEEFHEWVMENGGLGEGTTSWRCEETYESWNP